MKIIATTPTGVIAELSKTELANLIGFYSEYSKCENFPQVGAEVKINEMFMQLYRIRGIRSSIKKLSEGANELLESIRVKDPVIQPIVAAIEAAAPKEG
jgi:hypothetical protein